MVLGIGSTSCTRYAKMISICGHVGIFKRIEFYFKRSTRFHLSSSSLFDYSNRKICVNQRYIFWRPNSNSMEKQIASIVKTVMGQLKLAQPKPGTEQFITNVSIFHYKTFGRRNLCRMVLENMSKKDGRY